MIRRPFRPQYKPLILAGQKNHTVRPVPKRLPKIGEEFVGYCWTGKPYRSPQDTFFKSTVTKVDLISIVAPTTRINDRVLPYSELHAFAQADGFKTTLEFLECIRATHGLPYIGIVIHWQPVKSTTNQ